MKLLSLVSKLFDLKSKIFGAWIKFTKIASRINIFNRTTGRYQVPKIFQGF